MTFKADMLKRQGEESRTSYEHMRAVFLKQLEQMELDELEIQEKIRQELKEVEQQYHALQNDYNKLHIEYQQVRNSDFCKNQNFIHSCRYEHFLESETKRASHADKSRNAPAHKFAPIS